MHENTLYMFTVEEVNQVQQGPLNDVLGEEAGII